MVDTQSESRRVVVGVIKPSTFRPHNEDNSIENKKQGDIAK